MPAPRPLSRSLIPIPGESLPGFLLRLSYRLNLPPARLADLTGLRSVGVRGSRLPPVLVAGIPAPAVQESFGGPWLKTWHLPVVFACPAHRRLLEHCCPDCGNVVRRGRWPRRTSAVLPAMWTTGLHPAQCRAELTPSSGGRSLPACCGARLDQAGHSRQASAALIDIQVKILDLLRPDGPASTLSAGQPAPPIRYFADLRALGLLACSTWPAARFLSPDEDAASAIDEHVAMLEREAARQQGTSSSASRAGFDVPPIDAAASGGLAHIADRILAGSPDEVRERLSSLLPTGSWKKSGIYWGLRAARSATPCSEGLYAAYAPLSWGFSRAGSQPAGRRNAVLHPRHWGPENIPAFLPGDWYSRHFTPIEGVSGSNPEPTD